MGISFQGCKIFRIGFQVGRQVKFEPEFEGIEATSGTPGIMSGN